MPRTYARVETRADDRNQVLEIMAAGFHVEPASDHHRDGLGQHGIAQRRGFIRLMDRLETGDVLIVPKLDRLAIDSESVSYRLNTVSTILPSR